MVPPAPRTTGRSGARQVGSPGLPGPASDDRPATAGGADRGTVSVELALALPAVVALMAVVLVVGAAAASQLAVTGGARAGARAAALGQSDAEIEAAARATAGGSVTVTIDRGGAMVRVTCTRSVAVPPFGQRLASASAAAACEPARGCG